MNMSNVVVVKSNLPRFSNLAAALWCGWWFREQQRCHPAP